MTNTPPAIGDEDIVPDKTDKPAVSESLLSSAQFRVVKKLEAEAPNRRRRTAFVFGSWTLSFVATVFLSFRAGDGAIAKAAVEGFTSYMMAVATMYIVGYSVDQADFVNKAKAFITNKVEGEQ